MTTEEMMGGMFGAFGFGDFYHQGDPNNLYMHPAGPSNFGINMGSGLAINKHNPLSLSQAAMPVGMMGLNALSYGTIAYTQGAGSAMQYAMADVSTNAALYRYHFKPAAHQAATHGIVAPGIFSGAFNSSAKNVAWSTRGLNTLRFAGGSIGGGLSGLIGGSTLGAAGKWWGAQSPIMPGFNSAVLGIAGQAGGTVLGAMAGTAIGTAVSNPIGLAAAGAVGLGVAATAATAATATGIGYGTYSVLKAGYGHRQRQKQIHTSGSLAAFHTQSAQTMRSRAVQAISKSHHNGRSALGMEANYLHYPSKSYTSRWR